MYVGPLGSMRKELCKGKEQPFRELHPFHPLQTEDETAEGQPFHPSHPLQTVDDMDETVEGQPFHPFHPSRAKDEMDEMVEGQRSHYTFYRSMSHRVYRVINGYIGYIGLYRV